ncbi:hypothetical protein CXG48_16955 [Pseudomonas plecoglossicida]|nr:hypothetical protein CSW00_00510 [Pseudomonas sp. MR 02]PLV02303.1 hypothetical protein CXG48_16955 [Pseudomonas plecoglossicida]
MSRKGCKAAPAISTIAHQSWGRVAALSRHKAAPTGTATTSRVTLYLCGLPAIGPVQVKPICAAPATDPAPATPAQSPRTPPTPPGH